MSLRSSMQSNSGTAASIDYTMAMNVSSLWDQVKMQEEDYVEVLGELIFQRLFMLNPNAGAIFGMSDVDSKDIKNHKSFKIHAATIVDMIDCVVQFLGPNIDSLEEFLLDLGKRHVSYGVRAEDLSSMGRAAVYATETVLGSQFTLRDLEEWTVVFQFMTTKMAEGMTK